MKGYNQDDKNTLYLPRQDLLVMVNKMDELKKHIYDEMEGLYYALIGNQNVPLMNFTVKNAITRKYFH